MPRIVHFEVSADDLERAQAFYGTVFGWKFHSWGEGDYLLADTGEGPGIHGALMKPMQGIPRTVNTLDVPDIDLYMAKVVEAGGKVLTEKQEVPTIGIFAYAQDPEGNVFGMMQFTNQDQK